MATVVCGVCNIEWVCKIKNSPLKNLEKFFRGEIIIFHGATLIGYDSHLNLANLRITICSAFAPVF